MIWPLFLTAFVFIFFAALPGRTTFLMIIMAARGNAKNVLLGALLAFGLQAGISIALSQVVALFPQQLVHVAVALLFFYFALQFWRDSHKQLQIKKSDGSSGWKSPFLLIFAAEWGDVSQVAIASFAALHPERLTVFLSAILALWIIAGGAVTVGARLGRSIAPARIQLIASVGFAATAIYMLGQALSSR